ncbi:MAG: hypothetical protein ACXWCZ_04995 [Flavisolibacter sp.]
MKYSENIQNELKGLNSSLPNKASESPFSVPEGYFEGFAASVIARIKNESTSAESASAEIAQLSPCLASISRTMPFEVPENYFQTNIDVLPAIINDNEDSLVLSFIEKDMPLEVPQGYFFNLPERVMETVEPREHKVVKMSGRKWMRIAVAAMIAGIITVSGIVYFKTDNHGNVNNNTVANQTIKPDIKKELKAVSTAELDAFINTRVVNDYSATAKNSTKNNDVKTLLEDVSDKELDAFLDQVPTDVEEEIVL